MRPVMARTLEMASFTSAIQLTQSLLMENWSQFVSNLMEVSRTRNPEFLHQARVGWRRFNSTLRFFKPLLPICSDIPPKSLRPLLDLMGKARDVDVVVNEILPLWFDTYTNGDPRRKQQWNAMIKLLVSSLKQGRLDIGLKIHEPGIKNGLKSVSIWIGALQHAEAFDKNDLSGRKFRKWMAHRLGHHYRKLNYFNQKNKTHHQHKARILAKQFRYEVEMLSPILTHKWNQKPLLKAKKMQAQIGLSRDRLRAYKLVKSLRDYPEVVYFIQSRLDAR